MAKRSEPEADPAPAQDFDGRLARLEAIVQEMEQGGLGLEGAIARYEEGVALLKGCREVLAGYRHQVEELTRDAEKTLEPYAADPDVPSAD
jgi:exodeoxyribonuclease VII small subunit